MRYFLLAFFFSITFGSYAQLDDIRWSDAVKLNGTVVKTLVKDKDNYYAVTVTKNPTNETRIYHVQHGVIVHDNIIPNAFNNSINTLENIYTFNNDIYVFFSSQKATSNQLFVQKIGDNCQLLGEPILLNEQSLKTTFNSKDLNYIIDISPNEEYLSICYLYDNENVLKFPKLKTFVYDRNLEEINYNTLEVEYYMSELALETVRITNEGSVMVLIQGLKRPSSFKTSFNSLDLYIISTEKEIRHESLEIKNYTFFNPIIRTENDTTYTIAFQYNVLTANKKFQSGSKGVVFYEYNSKTDSLSESSEIEFDKKYLINLLDSKSKKRYETSVAKGKEYNLALFNYKLKNIFRLEDNSQLLVMEENWSVIRNIQDGRMSTTYYLYNYNNVMLMKFDEQLVRDYSIVIPKVQVTRDDDGYYSSFFQYKSKDNHLKLFFNDNYTNYSPDGEYIGFDNPENISYSSKRICLTMIDFDINTGRYTRKPVYQDNVQGLLIPRLAISSDIYNTIVLTLNYRNVTQFAQFSGRW